MSVDERSRTEIVARVLGRIAEYRYYADEDEDGELIVIPDYGPTFSERECTYSIPTMPISRFSSPFTVASLAISISGRSISRF